MSRPHSKGHRWTIEAAAGDFGIDRKTLKNRIRELGLGPGTDNKFSTQDICKAVFGDYSGERLRKLKAERELLEIELGKQRRELIPVDEVYKLLENIFLAIRSKIIGSHLSQSEQDAILLDLHGLKDADL